ncbi:hypothetical protein [Helicobacter salomonis]|uniref:hypothetical protein n=1 Tax=Helicobacter salomonis TaxID=56878 RepID=UPI000CF02D3A|nr:hypothetical protein [Helicobacter salomonis]
MAKRTFSYITHIPNTSKHKVRTNVPWLRFWKDEVGDENPDCCIEGCPKKADRGAHVYLDDERSWWIVPVCASHNPANTSSWDVKAGTIAVEAKGNKFID